MLHVRYLIRKDDGALFVGRTPNDPGVLLLPMETLTPDDLFAAVTQ